MGVLTFSLHFFTTPQRERLSSSNLSSTRCAFEMGNPELCCSNLFPKNSPRLRLHLRKPFTSHGVHQFCSAQVEAFASLHPIKRHLGAYSSLCWVGQPRLLHIPTSQSYSLPLKAVINSGTQETSNEFIVGNEKIGVLLLNLGGPETLDDVQPFLFNLFADPDIIRLPRLFRFLQNPLAKFISISRAPKSREGYASIGGGSPLRQITDAQAEELKKSLIEKDIPAKVYVGMRYWHPFTEEAIEHIKRDRITKLVVLPLYPQFSISTSGSSLRLLENIFREDEYLATKMKHTVIPSWYQRKGYIMANANLIEMELQKFKCPDEVMIFFSAHGVPLAYVEEAGDPYKAEMEECVELIMEELEHRHISNSYALAYQSRVGPVEWLKPYTDQTIVDLAQRGVKSLLAVPISFVSEHIETLEEIDVEYKELALKSGIQEWGRVPALGCEPNFISDLAYCAEDKPFVRMMIFEYAPNGTLNDHLHNKEAMDLNWPARMRIAMGIVYCLDHMHQLDPPVFPSILNSNSILLTDDCSAKISDIELTDNIITCDGNSGPLVSENLNKEDTIYKYGMLLLEIVTGRISSSEVDGELLMWASDYLVGRKPMKDMIDPMLKDPIDDKDFTQFCRVITSCLNPDPKQRPSARDVTTFLREITAISPEGAVPKLSPLWWAELEITSNEEET